MKYPMFKVHIDVDSAMNNLETVLRSGFLNEGEQVTEFTQKVQEKLETNHAIMLNSCTSALTLALKICGADNDGSYVMSTPMTCVATNCPIVTNGAHIQWVDINYSSGCMSPIDLREKLERGPKPAAVIIVAWAGIPPEIDEIKALCNEWNVPIILDAAHALGAKYKGKFIHEWVDFTCYSFQAIKHITTGDGGMLICKDEETYNRAKKLKWFGFDRDEAKDEKGNWKGQRWEMDVSEPGYKFSMNNIAAAIGLSQLEHMDSIIQRHKDNADEYDNLFFASKYVTPVFRPYESEPSHWVYTMLLHNTSEINRDKLLRDLNAEGIGAGLVHLPNTIYSGFKRFNHDVEKLYGLQNFAARHFSLPVGWWLNKDDIIYIHNRVTTLCEEQLENWRV